MFVYTRYSFNMMTGEVTEREGFEYNGPVDQCCGAGGGLVKAEHGALDWFSELQSQAKNIFGSSAGVFHDLMNAFKPIIAAGPNQHGFTPGTRSALDSQAITNTGIAARNAQQAVREANAAQGGGNTGNLTGGQSTAAEIATANTGATETARQLNEINLADFSTGRQNYDQAIKGMEEAPGVFNPATSAASATTSAGTAGTDAANAVTSADSSWQGVVGGVLGGVAGGLMPGGAIAKSIGHV